MECRQCKKVLLSLKEKVKRLEEENMLLKQQLNQFQVQYMDYLCAVRNLSLYKYQQQAGRTEIISTESEDCIDHGELLQSTPKSDGSLSSATTLDFDGAVHKNCE